MATKSLDKMTGHIHVGFLEGDKDGTLPNNRTIMLQIIENILKEVIENF